MEWRKVTDYPKHCGPIVLLYNNGNSIEFNADFNGENYRVFDAEDGTWNPWSIDLWGIVGWMYLSDVEEYLRGLKDKEE